MKEGALFSERLTSLHGRLNLAALLLTLAVPSFAQATDGPSPMDHDSLLPYRAHWGPYTVTVVGLGNNEGDRFRILDAQGNMLREIEAPGIQEVDYPRLSGQGPADLRVLTFPGSNIIHARETFVFTRAGGLRNVLIMPEGFDAVRDLNHDGGRELIADTVAPLEYVADVCHGCSPTLMLVLGWDGHRYVVQNRRFPWLARRKAWHFRWQFLKARDHPDEFRDHLIAPAVGYWANRETIGEGKPALHWLMQQMPQWARQWFLEALPDVRARLARLPRQITVSQQKEFVLSED